MPLVASNHLFWRIPDGPWPETVRALIAPSDLPWMNAGGALGPKIPSTTHHSQVRDTLAGDMAAALTCALVEDHPFKVCGVDLIP